MKSLADPCPGYTNFGREIEQRLKYERALVQPRVRQGQWRALDDHVAEQQQIQVYIPRRIFLLALATALAAEHQFDIEQMQQ